MITAPNSADLDTLEQSGKAPKERITSAQQVREIYNKAVRDNQVRSRKRAILKGLVDGNSPYDQGKLDQSGQRYRANFNNGEAEAFLNTAKDSFYDLFSEVQNKATVSVDLDIPEAVEWGEKITKNFEWLQAQDDKFDFLIQVSQHDMVLYGLGPVAWDDEFDWRCKRVSATNVYLPIHAEADVTQFPWVLIYRLMPVGDLYKFISDEKTARDMGWNPDAVKKTIVDSTSPGGPLAQNRDWRKWDTWQQAFRDGDIWISESSRQVGVVQMLYQEFSVDGEEPKISEVWVDAMTGSTQQQFLFKKPNRYDDMRQCFNAFFYDRGDGSAHGVRGLGIKMKDLLMAKNRLQVATVDAAFARSSIMIKSLGNQPQSAMSPVSLGPYVIIPQGFEPVTGLQNSGIIDAPLAVSQQLEATLSANLSQYRQNSTKVDGNPRTAFEVSQIVSQQASLQRTQIARYFQQLDDMYRERFRRASNPDIPRSTNNKWLRLAVDFQDRCAADGIPPEIFKHCKVKATRTVGQGSPVMRMGMLNQINATLRGLLPEDGQKRLTRDLIASQAGQDMVTRYFPEDIANQSYSSQQKWEAQVENASLRDGSQIAITPLQNDVIHLQEHIAFASQAAASVQQGANPAEVFVALNSIGQHAAMHLQRLSVNPQRQREFKAINGQFQQLAKVTDQIHDIAMQHPDQQKQTMQDPEVVLAAQKAQAEIALKKQKQDAQLAMRAQKQKFDQALKAQNQSFTQQLKDIDAAHGMASDEQQMAHDHAMDMREGKVEVAVD